MDKLRGRYTVADLFCDTYVASGGRVSYIMLPRLLVDQSFGDDMSRLLGNGARRECLTEVDGVPAYQVRNRFVKAIRQRGNNVTALFSALNLVFTEDAIRRCFTAPDIWLLNHNALARKRRAAEVQAENRARKMDPEGFKIHRQVEKRMANMSATKHAREERKLR